MGGKNDTSASVPQSDSYSHNFCCKLGWKGDLGCNWCWKNARISNQTHSRDVAIPIPIIPTKTVSDEHWIDVPTSPTSSSMDIHGTSLPLISHDSPRVPVFRIHDRAAISVGVVPAVHLKTEQGGQPVNRSPTSLGSPALNSSRRQFGAKGGPNLSCWGAAGSTSPLAMGNPPAMEGCHGEDLKNGRFSSHV